MSRTRNATLPDGAYAMTQLEVAAALGVSRSAIFAIERAALRKCKRVLARNGYTRDALISVVRAL